MDYLQVKINLPLAGQSIDQLIARLVDAGFEGFEEASDLLIAYHPASEDARINQQMATLSKEFGFVFEAGILKDQNWNARWESQYDAVQFGQDCIIRAPFHPPRKDIRIDIVIEPKMSFGTAHHETTSLMIEELLTLDVNHQRILDMGCGTAVLAILAIKLGASYALAIDNDEWAYRNAEENKDLNEVKNLDVRQGSIELIRDQQFDVIMANITRNILLEHIADYAATLPVGGMLLMSGFYENDVETIKQTTLQHRLQYISGRSKNRWSMLKFVKSNQEMT